MAGKNVSEVCWVGCKTLTQSINHVFVIDFSRARVASCWWFMYLQWSSTVFSTVVYRSWLGLVAVATCQTTLDHVLLNVLKPDLVWFNNVQNFGLKIWHNAQFVITTMILFTCIPVAFYPCLSVCLLAEQNLGNRSTTYQRRVDWKSEVL